MMTTLTQTALITGSATRVGKAMALHLAKQGYDIAIHCRNSRAQADALKSDIESLGRRACVLEADLQNADATARLVPDATDALGPLSLLINNASMFGRDNLHSFTAESVSSHMQIHALAPLLLIRAFASQLPEGAHGNIVNLTDGMGGWSMSPTFLSYTLSKLALSNITTLLARELAPRIRINTIAPGPTLEGVQDKPETFAKLAALSPLKRNSCVEEVCDALDYILRASAVTGQTISLNGGIQTLQPLT